MSVILKQHQFVIESAEIKKVGKKNFRIQTDQLLKTFFDDICAHVLNAEDGQYLIQWGIIQLTDGEREARENAAKDGNE